MADQTVTGGGSLQDALARVKTGEQLTLGPGVYTLNARMPRRVTLIGEPGAVLSGAISTRNDATLRGLRLEPASEVEVQMGTLKLHDCVLSGGAFVSMGGRLEMRGGQVLNPPQEAFAVQGASLSLQDVTLRGGRPAAIAAQDAELELSRCVFEAVAGNALDLAGSCEATLDGCSLENDDPSFPLVWAEASAVTLRSCQLQGAGVAVQVASGGSATLEGCEVSQRPGEGGVGLRALRGKIQLTDCVVRGAWGSGLWVDARGEAQLHDCRFEDNDRWREDADRREIHLAAGARLSVQGCTLTRFGGEALSLHSAEDAEQLATRGLNAHDAQALRLGLAAGAPATLQGEGGRSALHGLARAGEAASIAALVEAGADPEARDAAGRTPLHEAEDAATVAALLAAGADLFSVDATGATAVHTRVERPEAADALRALVLGGLSPDLPDREGSHPIARGVVAEQGDNVVSLARLGADPDPLMPDGRLPLSVFSGIPERLIVDALLELGADPSKRDARNKKPRYYADPHRIFRRTFRRRRDDPWEVPPVVESLERLGLSGEASAELPEAHEEVLLFLKATWGAPPRPSLALRLHVPSDSAPLPWSALIDGVDGDSPLLPIGRDPMGREAHVDLTTGRFLCLHPGDLRALLAHGARLMGPTPEALLEHLHREVATLSLAEALGFLALLDDRRALETAIGSRRKHVTRARIRRGMDWLRPWIMETRARWEPRVPEARARIGALVRDLDGDKVSEVFYHPLELAAARKLADPVHPLAHAWLDATRAHAQLGGLAGWATLAAQKPLTARRLWGADDASPLPVLELSRSDEGCVWLHLGTGRAARLSAVERKDPQIFNRLRWEEDIAALLEG